MPTLSRRNRREAGIGTPLALIMMGGLTAVGLGVASLGSVADRNGERSAEKSESRALAESGVHALYSRIRTSMRASQSYSDAYPQTDLSDHGYLMGRYSARVVSAVTVQSQVDMGDGSVATRDTTTFTLEGTGQTKGQATSIRSTFVGVLDRSNGKYQNVTVTTKEGDGNGVPFSVCPGAVMANTRVVLRSDGGLKTFCPENNGHVVANKGIVWEPKSGAKRDVRTSDVLNIQGQFQVPGSTEYAHIYDLTAGPDGIGNPNGSKNYRSPAYAAADGNPALDANTIVRREHPRPYPSEQMFNEWGAEIGEKAAKAKTLSGNVDTATVTELKAPVFIDGSLVIRAGTKLRLVPTSDKPWENIVYVRGDIKNYAHLANQGVTLVVLGKYTDSSTSQYAVDTGGPKFTTLDTVMAKANFISANPAADAVTFTTNTPQTTGLVYATHGGIRVFGRSPEIHGKLVAAGTGANAELRIEPAAGTGMTLRYNVNAGGNRHIVPSAETSSRTDRRTLVEPGTVVKPFDPGRLGGWSSVKPAR